MPVAYAPRRSTAIPPTRRLNAYGEPDYIQLQMQYGGRLVAHRDGEVLASAETHDELSDELERTAVDWSTLIVEYVESIDELHVY